MDWRKIKTGKDLYQFIKEGITKLDPTTTFSAGIDIENPEKVIGIIWIHSDKITEIEKALFYQYGCLVEVCEKDDFIFFHGSVFDFKDSYGFYLEKNRTRH